MAVHEEIIDGHMTVTRVRRAPKDGHKPGYIFVESLVYVGPVKVGEPVSDWELPHTYRYDLSGAARLAVAQTDFTKEG